MRIRNTHAIALLAGLVASLAPLAAASSHSEAPFVKTMPKIDSTDFYMFRSYEPGREGFITLIANYYPLQDPYGGPNYFTLDPDALYQIHIDNNGDSHEDLTLSFRFQNTSRDITLNIGGQNVAIPLVNAGMIGPGAGDNAALNVLETYSMQLVRGDRYTGLATSITNSATGAMTFRKPADNIGTKSIPNYPGYASSHIYNINLPGSKQTGRVFVGQRKDPFVVNLGEVFDLVNTNPLGPENAEQDDLADKNVTSLIVELPISYVLGQGGDPVVGAWTSCSLPRTRVLSLNPSFAKPASQSGAWTQVSRLSMPLVNEVVVGLRDKNKFSASAPSGDGQFLTYVTNPTLPALLSILFGVTPPCLPRNDLVQVFLTGVPGLNQPQNVVGSEMMRLNTGIAPTPAAMQSRLGVLGGDLAGYPNGRRLGDDVVDMSLRVVMGVLYPDAGVPGGCAPHGNLPLTDGAFVDASYFDNAFPYVRNPIPGAN
ncbi:MAG: DUF4331 domain-containing protein [Phycisphaerales bacterium]|nr:DUF4331 domain-containing protein [Phycisphaerales bacterium]